MDDLISRQAAIEVVQNRHMMLSKEKVLLINDLKKLPPAELKKGADMKFEDFEDKIKGAWVKVSDVALSISPSAYSYVEADVHIPCGVITLDMGQYTKYVQDKTIKIFTDALILNGAMSITTCRKIFPEIYENGETYNMAQILKRYSGSEIISRIEEYEKFKQAEESKKKQAEIEKAKALLESSGYTVAKEECKSTGRP